MTAALHHGETIAVSKENGITESATAIMNATARNAKMPWPMHLIFGSLRIPQEITTSSRALNSRLSLFSAPQSIATDLPQFRKIDRLLNGLPQLARAILSHY